jgi:hypothetical protein
VKKSIIVGFDPGTTAAIAVLDTKGRILLLESRKGLKKSDAINSIIQIGKPLIVAGDKVPLPKNVEKLASSLSCKSYSPVKTLPVIEKEKLVKYFSKEIRNEHEKDALAAALQFLKVNKKVFDRTEELLSSLNLNQLYDRVVELTITGKAENITEAINKSLTEGRTKPPISEDKEVIVKKETDKTIDDLQKKIKNLEKDVDILKNYNQMLKRRLGETEERVQYYKNKSQEKIDLDSVRRIKKNMDSLKSELESAKLLNEKLKSFRELNLNGYEPIIELEEVRNDKIKELDILVGLKDRIVLVKGVENLQIFNDYKIKALICPSKPEEKIMGELNFPIVLKKDISLEKMKNISVASKKEFEGKLNQARKTGFVEWIKEHKKRKL